MLSFSSVIHGVKHGDHISANYKYGLSDRIDDSYEPSIVITCEKDNKIETPDNVESLSISLQQQNRMIYRNKNIPFMKAKMSIDFTVPKKPIIKYNDHYSFWSNLRGTCAFYRVDQILEHVTTLSLFMNGYIPLHCASVSIGDKIILIIAPSNTGKTLTSYLLQKEYGANFMCEDIAITDGEHIYACPFTSTDLPDGFSSAVEKERFSLKKMLFPSQQKQSLGKHIPAKNIKSQGVLDAIVFLKRGDRGTHKLMPAEAYNQLAMNNILEFSYRDNKIVHEMWYRYGSPDVVEMHEFELERLKTLTANAGSIYEISEENPVMFSKRIAELFEVKKG